MLVGGIVDRAVVGGPAWQHLGADTWAAYSRHADLGTGLIVYPAEGIGAAVLGVAAALSHRFEESAAARTARFLYISAAGYLVGLVLTLKAAPIMLALARGEPAPSEALAGFTFWGLYLRGAADATGFLAGLVALVRR
jgi:hypothetical protein